MSWHDSGILKHKQAALTLVFGVTALILSGNASAVNLQVLGVSDVAPNCIAPINCDVQPVPQVSPNACAAGETLVGVNVTLGGASENTAISATNTSGFNPGCLKVSSVIHDVLKIRIPGVPGGDLELNGTSNGDGQDYPGPFVPIGVCNPAFDNGIWQFYRTPGNSVNLPNALLTAKAAINIPIPDTDPRFGFFVGGGTFNAELTAEAQQTVAQSGTWTTSVNTDAFGEVSVSPICTGDEKEVPAIAPLGAAALGLGVAGLGVMLGFRRRT